MEQPEHLTLHILPSGHCQSDFATFSETGEFNTRHTDGSILPTRHHMVANTSACSHADQWLHFQGQPPQRRSRH